MAVEHESHDEADVVTPQPQGIEAHCRVLDFVRAHTSRHGTAPAAQFFLSGSDVQDRVELTEELFLLLRQAAEALGSGRSVSLLARDQEITTQQAADLLGLSRPTVVKLIDDGELEAHVPGSVRRKLRLADVLNYRSRLHARRTDFIAESSREYGDTLTGVGVKALLAEARRAR